MCPYTGVPCRSVMGAGYCVWYLVGYAAAAEMFGSNEPLKGGSNTLDTITLHITPKISVRIGIYSSARTHVGLSAHEAGARSLAAGLTRHAPVALVLSCAPDKQGGQTPLLVRCSWLGQDTLMTWLSETTALSPAPASDILRESESESESINLGLGSGSRTYFVPKSAHH